MAEGMGGVPYGKGSLGRGIFNVTFEPGCRNNWHVHQAKSGGLMLGGAYGKSGFAIAVQDVLPTRKASRHGCRAYHDGIKGERSYYEPWGDVFVLYEGETEGAGLQKRGHGINRLP